jgi:hypothetical protein
MKHLTEEEISEIVHHWRAGGAAAAHLEQCRTCRQAVATQQPACLILSPLLTGGKVFK